MHNHINKNRILAYKKPSSDDTKNQAIEPEIIGKPNSTSLINDDLKLSLSSTYLPWLAMIMSTILWFKFGSANTDGSLGNTGNVYRIFLVVAGGLLAINLFLKNASNMRYAINTPTILLLLYGFVALFSAFLVPANAFYTMWKSIEIIVDVIIIMGIMSAIRNPAGAIASYRYIITIATITLIFVVVGAIISPSQGFQGSRGIIPFMLQGYFPVVNANGVGYMSALICMHNIAVWNRTTSHKRKTLAIFLVCMGFVTLIMAQSRTSTVALLIGFSIYMYLDDKKKVAFTLFSIAGIALIFTAASDTLMNFMQRGQSTELMTSLSGRTHGWTAAWDMFMESPWVGHGFAAAARTEILGAKGASTLHGSFFDVIVGVGLAGLVPWLGAILLTLITMFTLTIKRRTWITTQYERGIHAEMCAITTMVIIRSTTSSGISMHGQGFMILLAIIAYTYSVKVSRKNKPSTNTYN